MYVWSSFQMGGKVKGARQEWSSDPITVYHPQPPQAANFSPLAWSSPFHLQSSGSRCSCLSVLGRGCPLDHPS